MGYYYLNFSDLSEEAQTRLIDDAITELEESQKDDIMKTAGNLGVCYETVLQDRVERHIYKFDFAFNI